VSREPGKIQKEDQEDHVNLSVIEPGDPPLLIYFSPVLLVLLALLLALPWLPRNSIKLA